MSFRRAAAVSLDNILDYFRNEGRVTVPLKIATGLLIASCSFLDIVLVVVAGGRLPAR